MITTITTGSHKCSADPAMLAARRQRQISEHRLLAGMIGRVTP